MSIDFSVSAQAANLNQSLNTSTADSVMSGALFGHAAVTVESPMSLLADAAEELTFCVDTTDDFELSERKERKGTEDAMAERVELYRELMQQAGKSEELASMKERLRSSQGKENALREAQSHFPDPSDAWAALSDTLKEFETDESITSETLESIRAAIADLEASHGVAIQTGIHGALSAAGYVDAANLGGVDALRNLYRDTLCDFTTVEDAFTHLHETYGDADFDTAMTFLLQTLGNDLASSIPSMNETHLEHVNANLGQARLLQSAHSLCTNMLDRWVKVHDVTDSPLTSMSLLKQVVALRSENYLGAMHIDRIAAQAKAPDIEHEVLFLQEMLRMARNVPTQLFDGTQGRMRLIDAVQDAVDKAIEREDAFLAAQNEE